MEDRTTMMCPWYKEPCTDGQVPSFYKKWRDRKTGKVPRCRMWVKIEGKNAQDQKEDRYDCSLAWGPSIGVEQLRLENSTGHAVESLRNRVADMVTEIKHIGQNAVLVMPTLEGKKAIDTTVDAAPQLESKKPNDNP